MSCVNSSLVLLEVDVCYDQCVLLAKLCYNLPCFILYSKAKYACYSRYFLTFYFCILVTRTYCIKFQHYFFLDYSLWLYLFKSPFFYSHDSRWCCYKCCIYFFRFLVFLKSLSFPMLTCNVKRWYFQHIFIIYSFYHLWHWWLIVNSSWVNFRLVWNSEFWIWNFK